MIHLPSLFQFLSGLAENNNRPWFLHNKPQYDILKDEFAALVAEVGARVRKFDKALPPFEPKKSVFRIYRDVRFSKDKSPYKTHMGAVVGTRNMNDKTRPVHYFHIDHKGTLLVASGIYCPPPPVLKSIRDAIVANPAALTKALKNAEFKKVFKDIADEERMTRVPKGYDKDHPHAKYLMNRHFFCETTFDLSKKPPKDLPGKIADTLEAAMPVVTWLRGIKA
jgi:uncharacterized protein (TIGR02453 family)